MTRQEQKLQAFVVNGDPDQLNTLAGQLARFGVKAHVFESAEKALAAMDPAEPPGLVVTGLRLPGIDGWRFCRLLRSPEFEAFKDIPVLVVSAVFAGFHSDRIAADIGADAFLPSPVDEEEFAVVVQALLEGREAGRHLRALIVDDDEDLVDLLVKAFQENGYITDKVHTAREAEEVFARVPCDVIVLDYHVSGGSGDALIDLFRKNQPDCVLLVTAEDPAPELALSWMKRGASDYIRKPHDPELLIEMCARALRGHDLLRTENLLEQGIREPREEREWLEHILNITRTGIDIVDGEFNLRFVDKGWQTIYGDPAGYKCYEYFMNLSEPCPGCGIPRALETKEITVTEEILARENNRIVEVHTIPFQDDEGQWLVAEFNVDITERKRAEIQLQEKTELLQHITEHMFDLVAMADLEGLFTYVGPSHRILGYEPEQFVGTKVIDYVHPDDSIRIADEFKLFITNPTPDTTRTVEYRQRCADGSYLWLETMGKILFSEEGSPSSLFFSSRDITDRKQAEEAQQDSNRRLEAFLEVSRSITSSFEQDELMQAIVDNAAAVTGIGSGALYLLQDDGQIHLAATTPALPGDFPEEFRLASLDDHPHIREAIVSGSHVIMADSGTAQLTPEEEEVVRLRNLRTNLYIPIVLRGRSIGVLILSSVGELHTFREEDISLLQGFGNQAAQIFENIRNYEKAKDHAKELEQEIAERKRAEQEQKRLQSQLIQAQKMESVGRLAGGVAHDFNNMLGVILGHTELALEQVAPTDPLHADLEEIQKAAERSADLTRQLLTFARKQTVSPRVLDLNVTVSAMLKMLERLIGEDINLAWKPGSKLWPVSMDPSQVDQILANLCVNARDAIEGIGKITIETENVIFDEEYCARHTGFIPGEYVLLAVSDDGCGMDRETLDNIFDPFFTTKEMGKGTGLGLPSVYGAVKQNNGFVNVYSEPGQGTTFKVYLKRHKAGLLQVEYQRITEEPVRGSETILLVEDEEAILKMTTTMLERLGYTVLAARSPGEAIDMAANHDGSLDLLMTDVVMPEMNGRDLAEHMQSIHAEIKPLFTSGYTANVISHHGVLDDGVHFIQKPFSMNDLAVIIRNVLED